MSPCARSLFSVYLVEKNRFDRLKVLAILMSLSGNTTKRYTV